MTTAIIVDNKSKKSISKEFIEINLDILESYGNFRHGIDFVNFPSKIINGKTILEWFAIDQISYWWFAAPILHPKYNEAKLFIQRFSAFIDKNSINQIKLEGIFDKTDLIKQIAKQRNIKIKISYKYFPYLVKSRIKKLVKKTIYKKIMREKIKKRDFVFNKFSQSTKIPKNPVIITSPDIYRRETYDFVNEKSKQEEFFIKPFLNIFKKNKIETFCFDLDYTLKGTTNILEERLKTSINWMPIDTILKKPKSKKTIKTISLLKNSIDDLIKSGKDNILIYDNISLTKYLKQNFEDLFLEPNLPTYIHLMELLEDHLQKIKPRAIIQVYETGTYAKTFEIVAKKLGIKTLAIQHGLIPTDFPEYICKEINSKKFPLGNFIPDKTLVYGKYYKKILTEIGTYPEEKVEVIGHPSYFNFEETKKLFNKSEILKKNSFNDEKIILFPLSMRFFYIQNSPDRILLNTLFKEFKNNPDVKILVRPHPGDVLDQDILNNFFPNNNFIISKNTLFEDIIMSDIVVILPISSVSSEIPIFEKPLLLVNVENDNSIKSIDDAYLQLVEHDVAQLISLSNLTSTINSIEKNEIWKKTESKKRIKFLEDYFNYENSVDILSLIE